MYSRKPCAISEAAYNFLENSSLIQALYGQNCVNLLVDRIEVKCNL